MSDDQEHAGAGSDRPHPLVDHGHDTAHNAFEDATSPTGQQYSLAKEEAEGRKQPSGHPLNGDPATITPSGEDRQGRDIPPEAGRRASFDPKTGEVHGSGSGAGGGQGGEDLDEETAGGS